MKRGELLGQPFIIIFSMIIMAIILVFGVRSFTQIKDTANTVDAAQFILQLKDETTKYYNFDIGSSKKENLLAPGKITDICFYDQARTINVNLDPYIKSILEQGRNNLYFLPPESYSVNSYTLPHLRNVDTQNPYCIPKTNGKITFLLETRADSNDAYVGVHRA